MTDSCDPESLVPFPLRKAGGRGLERENLASGNSREGECDAAERRLRALTLDIARAEELERQRIAAGLHDDVGQLLAMVKVRLGEALLAGDLPATAAERVGESRRLLGRAIREIRTLTFELSSPLLHELGLEAGLKSLAKRMTERYSIACRFEAEAALEPLGGDLATALHSIARELLWNIVKHSGARSAALTVRRDGGEIRLTVSDDGAGFKLSETSSLPTAEGGFGLFRARETLQHLGGCLEVASAPGAGTWVCVTCPVAGNPPGPSA